MNEPDAAGPGPVTVFTVRDPGLQAVAESVLKGAGIPFYVKNQNAWNLTPFFIWVELQVDPAQADEARALLADLARP
jgi:hypothetical protein